MDDNVISYALLIKGIKREARVMLNHLDAYPDPVLESSLHSIACMLSTMEDLNK